MAALCVITIVATFAALLVPAEPVSLRSIPVWGCDICDLRGDLLMLAPADMDRATLDARMIAQLGQPHVQLTLQAARLVQFLPFAIMLLSVGLALRSLASGGFATPAIRWMRRAAFAAIALVLLGPAAHSIRLTALSAAIHQREHLIVLVDLADLLVSLLVAGAAWVSLRVLEGACTIRTELEEIV